MIESFLLVAAGGAVGSMLRFAIGNLVSFPYGTMAVNILGAFFAGVVIAFFINKVDAKFYLLLMPGFLGGFTTFSAFSVDVLKLWDQQNLNVLFFYFIGTLIFSLLCVWLSYKVTMWYFG